jgi:nitrate reductase (cytochrome), electron transfer subunit
MEKPEGTTDRKMGKIFLVFAGICAIALPVIVFSAFSSESKWTETELLAPQSLDFDHKGRAVFVNYDRVSKEYLQGVSTERSLDQYYGLRQYPGSPPYIPHEIKEADLAEADCLACHGSGGWTEELKRHTPITPHPEQTACRQCHVGMTEVTLFTDIDWMSIPPPRLGRSELPGGPTPIPHNLQMRENCMACHVGPATVSAIRVEHPSRGNCRQCHVPDSGAEPYERKSDS